jgi:RNA polymerase sigma-70 factor (ECF subfamily)
MPMSWPNAAQSISAARAGSNEALGEALEACRNYLLLIAEQELEQELRAKGGASDLVQQTFLEAQRDFSHFDGTTHEALLAWMRRMLLNNLANFRRDFRRQKRLVAREVRLSGDDESSVRDRVLPSDTPTPSGAVMLDEQARELECALQKLPDDYRRVIDLRYREERTFEEIGELMQRSSNAARKLWSRAIECVQQELDARP